MFSRGIYAENIKIKFNWFLQKSVFRKCAAMSFHIFAEGFEICQQ